MLTLENTTHSKSLMGAHSRQFHLHSSRTKMAYTELRTTPLQTAAPYQALSLCLFESPDPHLSRKTDHLPPLHLTCQSGLDRSLTARLFSLLL